MEQKKILIIDDEPNLLAAMDRTLGRKGFRVITAPNGQNGITLARRQHPDLIILDLSMPGMGGEEVAIRLKDDPETADIPIVFLTGLFGREQQEQRGHRVGGAGIPGQARRTGCAHGRDPRTAGPENDPLSRKRGSIHIRRFPVATGGPGR